MEWNLKNPTRFPYFHFPFSIDHPAAPFQRPVRARPEISVSFLGAEAPGSQGARREHAGRM